MTAAESQEQDWRPTWLRLGNMLIKRRALDLGMTRQQLAALHGLSYRNLSDIEIGRRNNYRSSTLAAFELAYALAPGAIDHVLDGGDLVTADQAVNRPTVTREYEHPNDQSIWEITGIPESDRRMLIDIAQAARHRREQGRRPSRDKSKHQA